MAAVCPCDRARLPGCLRVGDATGLCLVLTSQATCDGCSGCHPLPYTDANQDINSLAITNGDGDSHSYRHPHCHPYRYLNVDPNKDRHTNADRDKHADPYPYPDTFAHSDCPSNAAPTLADA